MARENDPMRYLAALLTALALAVGFGPVLAQETGRVETSEIAPVFPDDEPPRTEPEIGKTARDSAPPAGSPWAEQFDREKTRKPSEKPVSAFWSGGYAVFTGLTIVVGLLLVLYWAMRKFVPGAGGFSSGGAVLVLTRSAISPKHSIYVVRVAGRVLVLGVTGESIRTLSEVTDATEIARLVSIYGPEETARWSPFKKFMREEQEKVVEGAARPESVDEIQDELERIRKRLDTIE